ncbi:MAG: LysR substrate-binding domain-containing protein [Burkholderiaceae bacterium]
MRSKRIRRLELRQLRYFVAVAEELHFGRAAARLQISQPPLSEQIRSLEEMLGTPLFERTRRQVLLTSAGRTLHTEAVKLLAHAERVGEVMTSVRSGRSGQLFLGCVPTGLFSVLPTILESLPGTLDVRVTEAHTSDIITAVTDGRLDAGLVWEERAPPQLSIRSLERIGFIAALHQSHRLATRKRVSLADLAADPLIFPPRGVTPHQFDRINAAFRSAGLTPRLGQEASSVAAQLGFVACGLGYALVPVYARQIAIAGIAFVPLRAPVESVPLSLIWNQRRASTQMAAFLKRVTAVFSSPRSMPQAARVKRLTR